MPALSATAQTVWTGTTGDWFANGNWSLGAPGPTTDARVDNGGTSQVLSGSAAAQSIILGYGAPDSGTLATGGGTLAVTSDISVGYGGDGALAIDGGAVVSDYSGEIGYTIDSSGGAHGDVTVDGAGSAWNHTYELYVGYGTGTLTITNGASVSDYYGYLGYFPESPGRSSGTANVDGAGSTWSSSASLHVGDSGTGILNVTRGGLVINGEGHLGFNPGSDGTATIDGAGSNWVTNGFFYVGNGGNGTLTVRNGGAANSLDSYAYIGYSGNSASIATIDGAGSAWNNVNGLYVGFNGDGELDISGGGAMHNGSFANVGFSPGASGTLTVAGAGSMFTTGGALSIGGNVGGPGGTGFMRIDGGGFVAASAVNVWNTGTLETGDGATIAAPLTIDGGTLRAAAGSASIGGDLELTSTPTSVFVVSGAGAASLHASGGAALGGGLVVAVDAGATPGGPYTLITADNGLNGSTFASVSIDPPDAGLTPQITYDANHVYLALASTGGAVLSIAPGSVDFGTVPAGITVGPAAFTLTSSGTGPVDVSAIDAANAPFAQNGGDCPAPPFELAPSASCTLAYTFAPTTIGPASQSIGIASNAGTQTISLSGTGIAGVPTTLVLAGGSGQSATVGTPFASPLVAEVQDDFGNPVPGITVSFAAPGSGASAVLSATSAVSDVDGHASVDATANAVAGSYQVTANGGLGAPVSFALTNLAAVADIGVGIVADRGYARAGEILNYTVTLQNTSANAANGAAIASTLSPLLDAAAATWTCIGPPESGCTASGQGELVDSGLAIPPGGSVSYVLSAPVRAEAGDGVIETDVHATLAGDPNAANDAASATTTIVLFRDGFEPGVVEPVRALGAPVHAGDRMRLTWTPAVGAGIRTVLSADDAAHAANAHAFRVERLDVGRASWARLVVVENSGAERASAWMPADIGGLLDVGALAVAATDASDRASTLLMIGPAAERRLPLAAAMAYRVVTALPLRIDAVASGR